MKIICAPLTIYAFLNFLLINNEKYSDILFVFQNANPSFKEISKRMKKKNIEVEEIAVYNKVFLNRIYIFIRAFIFNLKYKNNLIYGQDHLLFTKILKNDIYLLEDGLGNYLEVEKKKKKIFSKEGILSVLIGKKNTNFGRGDNVKKIYLTGLAKIPSDIENKVEIINLQNLWDEKSVEQKKEILELFGINKELEVKNYRNKIIFLTQPFFEANLLTYEEEIEMYKNILKEYGKKDVIIKPHPTDRKDYSEIFPEYEIMESSFPFELIKLNKIKFKKVVTIFSTAAFNLEEDQDVDFLGTEIHPKLVEKCGKITKETLINKF